MMEPLEIMGSFISIFITNINSQVCITLCTLRVKMVTGLNGLEGSQRLSKGENMEQMKIKGKVFLRD